MFYLQFHHDDHYSYKEKGKKSVKWNFIFNRLKPVPQQKLSDKLIPVLVPVLKTRRTILENNFFKFKLS